MRQKKNTLVRKDGKVFTDSRTYGEEAYKNFMVYKQGYDKKTYRRYVFRLIYKKEPELIEYLESHEFVTEYIKDLIRKDYNKQVKAGKWTPSKEVQKELAKIEKEEKNK